MYEYLFQNARIIDGTGAPAFTGDVAVYKGKIEAVAPHINPARTRQLLDASHLTLTPGFIDIHRHADAALFREGFGKAEAFQGLTTIVNGNCGQTLVPAPHNRRKDILEFVRPVMGDLPPTVSFSTFREYREAVSALKLPLHVETLIGNGTVCASLAGYGGVLSAEAVKKAQQELEKALSDGACGVSLGLGYLPECLYSTETLTALLEPLRGSDKPLTTHIRGEGDGVLDAISEVIGIAKKLHIRLEISHLKCMGKRNWGKTMRKALQLIETAAGEGVSLACDVYPYCAGSTQLMILMPNRFKSHGTGAFLESLKDPAVRCAVTKDLQTPSRDFENTVELVGWDHIFMTTLSKPENKRFEGLSVTRIAAMRRQDPYECAYSMLIEENGNIAMIDEYAAEEDVRLALSHPKSSVISDAIYSMGILHPRVYGAFSRIIEEYVYAHPLFSLEEAVKKMTSLPAEVMGFRTKGRIREGMDADLLLFRPERIHTGATYEHPNTRSEGIAYSLAGGKPVIWDGRYLG